MRVLRLDIKNIDGDVHYMADTGCSFGSCIFTENQSPHINQCDYLDLQIFQDKLVWACNKPTCLSACEGD
jgi:hypothetical protein